MNGQVFAVPVHLCQSMAMTVTTSISSSEQLEIHNHHAPLTQLMPQSHGVSHDMPAQEPMKNCMCVDCDCSTNMVAQTNSSLVSDAELAPLQPNTGHILIKREQDFISQPHTNPFRPPIFS